MRRFLESCRALVRFILSVEISSIYKKYEKTRKVHNLIFFPDLRFVSRLNAMLTKVGNLSSDGRPILGLDSKELLRMALDASHETYFVPAHIWTPTFRFWAQAAALTLLKNALKS